jgi:endonuclease/exonuclease/phosphatase family metal-dependent hydrolase
MQSSLMMSATEGTSHGLANPDKSIRILFWNVHKHDLCEEVSLLAKDLLIDTVVLLEHGGDPRSYLLWLQQRADPHFAIPNHISSRFLVLSRIPFPDFEEVLPSSRFSIRRFRHQNEYALLALFHGLDPINYNIDNRSRLARELSRDLREAMKLHQTNKALIVGDFNLNPYDSVMNDVTGLNAMMTKSCVTKGARKFDGRAYDYFYNPMWSLLGDLSPGASGSIYYKGYQGNYGWNMFDQVLLHHSLACSLLDIRIIDRQHGISLANKRGHPNTKLSDHFPLFVAIAR